ncbi:hypothetical protein B0E53_06748 [Micromonospora sp. MH33]|nr:hypothetical protein B0E53_06748 [Micromonospora sp. MH33]
MTLHTPDASAVTTNVRRVGCRRVLSYWWCWVGVVPRRRDPAAPRVVHRTARVALRVTSGQRRRCFGLLRSAGDVWACVLEVNGWRRRRRDAPLAGYQELCRELSVSGPGTFGELDSTGARSVLRRFSDAWFAAAKRRKDSDVSAGFPRRRRGLMPVRWYHGTFTLDGHRVRVPCAKGAPPLWVRLARELPYPVEQVRSITLLCEGGRLFLDVTAEVPVATYPSGEGPDPARVAGVDLGSSTRTRWPARTDRRCWCRGGRSAPNTACTWPTPRPAAVRSPDGPRSPVRRGHGGGVSTGVGRGGSRAGTGAGCVRPSTRPPTRWCPGRSASGSVCCTWVTRVGCSTWTRGGGTTCGCGSGRSAGSCRSSPTRPSWPASPSTSSTNAAPPRPARPAGGGYRNPAAEP